MTGPILIQGAMDVELEVLRAHITAPRIHTIGGFQFWEGALGTRTLVLSATEIGMVNAACATTAGILRFSPSVIINQGLAGAQTPQLHVGDIVLGETAVEIHNAETAPRKRGEGCAPFSWQCGERPDVLTGDSQWLRRLGDAPYGGGAVIVGRLGSGDVFNREYDRIWWLARQRGHLCEDMESFACYSVCARLGVPCVGARIISNNELTGEGYDRTVADKLQEFLLCVL